MKREEKGAISRQRILEAALQEFSARGYEGASLNTVWAEHGISKGIIYHYFKDKNEIYLFCVKRCFDALTAYLGTHIKMTPGTTEERLQAYFDARTCFFATEPLYLGIFCDVMIRPPAALSQEIALCRSEFDALSVAVLTDILNSAPLRAGLSVAAIVEDFRMYMDSFHLRFQADLNRERSTETILKEHEERCHRQLDILLHGVFGD